MAKFRGTATVVWYFDAVDKQDADRQFDEELCDLGYRDAELEEIEEAEYLREAPDANG